MTKVSIVIPAYNEQDTILQLLELVAGQDVAGIETEVIVIDDGSIDRTVALLKDRPELYSRLIEMPRNGGKGAAVRAGLREATGDYILFQDADLEYDPGDYHKLFEPVLRFDADIVMGSRLVASPLTRVHYFWHQLGNKFITLTFNIFNNTTFSDVYSCYLLYRRNLINPDTLATDGWQQQAEILSHAVRGAKKMYEVPINYYGRTYDEGKKIRAKHAISVLWTIVTCRLFS